MASKTPQALQEWHKNEVVSPQRTPMKLQIQIHSNQQRKFRVFSAAFTGTASNYVAATVIIHFDDI